MVGPVHTYARSQTNEGPGQGGTARVRNPERQSAQRPRRQTTAHISSHSLRTAEKIQRSQAAIGKYDGQHPTLTCATIAGKVFLHNPHQSSLSQDKPITYLNINKQITALAAGCLRGPEKARDVLLVGTPSSLHCYDVDQNKDLFFKDLTDGVDVILVGKYGAGDQPLALVGGNCSVQVREPYACFACLCVPVCSCACACVRVCVRMCAHGSSLAAVCQVSCGSIRRTAWP